MHEDLPVFPLGLVLLPGEELPLHIFEPRYRELTERCLTNDEPFALVLADGGSLRSVGCTAYIERVLTTFEDGRSNIVVRGGSPVVVRRMHGLHSYHSAVAEELDDEREEPDEALETAALTTLARISPGDAPSRGPRLSYLLASLLSLPTDVKQSLLEDRSERSRLSRVNDLLVLAERGIALTNEAERRARRNGRIRTADELATELGL